MIAAAAVIAIAIGGTLAWLSSQASDSVTLIGTDQVTVTMSDSNISSDAARVVPGASVAFNPTLTVTNTVDAYLFVKIVQTHDLFTYTVDASWQALSGQSGVYYQKITGSNENVVKTIMTDGTITYADTLTNAGDGQTTSVSTYDDETIQVRGYAIQADYLTGVTDDMNEAAHAAVAWGILNS